MRGSREKSFNRIGGEAQADLDFLYGAAEKKIRAMKFPAYGAQITAYVVSGLAYRTGGRIDFDRLWFRQAVGPEMEKLVEAWAHRRSTSCCGTPRARRIPANGSRRKIAGWTSRIGCQLFPSRYRLN